MSFDVVAPWYRALETIAFGNALQRARIACLDGTSSPRRALVVGEGNGRFLSALLREHPGIEVDCVDTSERMLALARKRIEREGCKSAVQFLHQDILTWTPPAATYDLIVTHFLLDCFPEDKLADIVARLSGAAMANATWLSADFRMPVSGLARLQARGWLLAMYRFFRLTARIKARELVDPSPFLRRHGFVLERQYLFRNGMLKSELWRRA